MLNNGENEEFCTQVCPLTTPVRNAESLTVYPNKRKQAVLKRLILSANTRWYLCPANLNNLHLFSCPRKIIALCSRI